jgi:glutamine synthetase
VDKQRDFVLRTIEERGIKFIRLWFTDVVGTLKSVAIAPAEVEGAFAEGLGFDGSAIEGLTRAYEADVLAHPDPTTFQILPWRGEIDPTARMFCDITTPDGQPAVADPRNVLKRTLAKAGERGFTFYTHPEIEFYLLKNSKYKNGGPVPVDSAGYFDNVPGGTAHDFRRRSVRMLEDLGISVEFSHHEAGPGQNEIDLRYADALTTADNIMTFRTVIKEVAIEQGVYATFMPKPLSGHPGSGMHTHMSLFEGDVNAFFDAGAQYQLSKIGRQFVAGLLRHAPEITAVTNQFVNSYSDCGVGMKPRASSPGATTTARLSFVCRCTSPTRGKARESSTVPWIPQPTPISPTRCSWPRDSRASKRATSSHPRRKTTSGRSPTRNARRSATASCPQVSITRCR